MAKKFELPNLENATDQFILDEMGRMSLIENYAKKARAAYREVYYARKGIKNEEEGFPIEGISHDGEMFTATTTQSFPSRVSVEMLKTEHPDIYEACLKTSSQLTTRFKLREGVVNPKVNELIDILKAELDLD